MPGDEVLGMRERHVEDGGVSFVVDGGRFALKWQESLVNARISFHENDEEMFAITAQRVQRLRDVLAETYLCESIDTFPRRGTWATVLLDLSAAVAIEQHRSSLRSRGAEVDETPKRFEE